MIWGELSSMLFVIFMNTLVNLLQADRLSKCMEMLEWCRVSKLQLQMIPRVLPPFTTVHLPYKNRLCWKVLTNILHELYVRGCVWLWSRQCNLQMQPQGGHNPVSVLMKCFSQKQSQIRLPYQTAYGSCCWPAGHWWKFSYCWPRTSAGTCL